MRAFAAEHNADRLGNFRARRRHHHIDCTRARRGGGNYDEVPAWSAGATAKAENNGEGCDKPKSFVHANFAAPTNSATRASLPTLSRLALVPSHSRQGPRA